MFSPPLPMSSSPQTRQTIHRDAFGPLGRIEPCETRLALSASLGSGVVLDLYEALVADQPDVQNTSEGGVDPASTSPDASLLDQARQLQSEHGLSGAGQTVAVIDSGVAWDHLALGGGYGPGYRVVGGWDFAENDADPYDDAPSGYHGTHVAGLLGASMDGYTGVAPGADLVALRVFDDNGYGDLSWIESALQWVHDAQDQFESPITTVNLSLGAVLNDSNRDAAMGLLEDELQLLHEDGILVFAAAGNAYEGPNDSSTNDDILYPASSSYVTAVSSIDVSGNLSSFAQRQEGIWAAEGNSITSTVPEHVFGWDGDFDDLAQLSGTSMATPQVAAASMLLREAMMEQGLDPTGEEVLQRLADATEQRYDAVSGLNYRTINLQSAIADLMSSGGGVPTTDSVITDNASDQFVLDLRDGFRVTVGDQTYELAGTVDGQALVLDGSGGADSLHIIGSEDSQRLRLSPNSDASQTSRLISGGVEIVLRGFEDVRFDGGGGNDRATLYDSIQDDQLESHPSRAVLSGVGFRFEVNDVNRTYVHATGGGTDVAYLYDSEGDDSLSVQPQFTSLRGATAGGEQTFQSAYGFESVYAYSTAGGYDVAELQDSANDDVLTVSPTRALISSSGYQVSARGFEDVSARAIAGGDDLVRFYSDETDSQWHRTEDLAQWTSENGATRKAHGFERVNAFENYAAVELSPQAMPRPLEDAESALLASRRVFEQLGELS